MAKDKKSFILYADLLTVVEKLVLRDREHKTNHAGELFLHILRYVNDEEPVPIDFIVEMAFEPIKLSLKRDLKKYETYIEKQRENGKKGGRPKNPSKPKKTQPLKQEPKKTDSVSDSDILLKEYSKNDFLKNWNEARKGYTGKESNLNTLKHDENELFKTAIENFKKEDFHKAIYGLFKQENVPSDIMWFRPRHLLGNIDTYIDAENNKSYKLYGK